jgi:hypothetical protein
MQLATHYMILHHKFTMDERTLNQRVRKRQKGTGTDFFFAGKTRSLLSKRGYRLVVLDGLDVEAEGGADDARVLPIDLEHDRCLP